MQWRHRWSVISVRPSELRAESEALNYILILADKWDSNANPMAKNSFGVWELTIPAVNGSPAIPHDSKIKASPYKSIFGLKSLLPS
jgi:hypothetical protein